MTYLLDDGAGDDDVLAAADDGDRLAREQLPHLLDERAEVAADVDLVGLDRAALVPHEQRNRSRLSCRESAAAPAR